MAKLQLEVPEVKQTRENSCWRACTHMILQYYGIIPGPMMPEEYDRDKGLSLDQIEELARRAGFRRLDVHPLARTIGGLTQALERNGPIFAPMVWSASFQHIVVVTGTDVIPNFEDVLVNDPKLTNETSIKVATSFASFEPDVVWDALYVLDLARPFEVYRDGTATQDWNFAL